MNIVIDNNTYTIEQVETIVRGSRGGCTTPKMQPYPPALLDLVDQMIQRETKGDQCISIVLLTLKGALLKTAKAHEILTTTGDVAQAIEALEASMNFREGE